MSQLLFLIDKFITLWSLWNTFTFHMYLTYDKLSQTCFFFFYDSCPNRQFMRGSRYYIGSCTQQDTGLHFILQKIVLWWYMWANVLSYLNITEYYRKTSSTEKELRRFYVFLILFLIWVSFCGKWSLFISRK